MPTDTFNPTHLPRKKKQNKFLNYTKLWYYVIIARKSLFFDILRDCAPPFRENGKDALNRGQSRL